ncbi:MAG: hypothetical protein K0S70_4158 [Microbacterium sp.]|nr:hypothetical protein [Microbacterium sp.]
MVAAPAQAVRAGSGSRTQIRIELTIPSGSGVCLRIQRISGTGTARVPPGSPPRAPRPQTPAIPHVAPLSRSRAAPSSAPVPAAGRPR